MMATCLTALSLNPLATLAKEPPKIQSEAAILIDGNTGQVLFEKNSDQEMYPASITKIVTAIMAIESGDLDDSVTVSAKARNVDGTRVYLEEGETVLLEKLVKGMLVNSGNDAAIAIAEHVSGSVESFAQDMNEFMKNKVGVENSHFVNPNGLFDESHVTTASDMAKITQYAMKNEKFRSLIGIKELDWTVEDWDTTLVNHHRLLLDYDFVTGGKNGYVSESGFTLVTTAKKDDHDLIVVTMKANDDQISYQDTLSLLNYGFNEFSPVVYKEETELGESDGEKYSLTKDLTLYQKSGAEATLSVTENGTLKSTVGSIQSNLDRDFLSIIPVEEEAPVEVSEAKPAVQVKDDDTESLLSSKTIFFGGVGIFISILVVLFSSRSKSSRKRYRSFP